MDERIRKLRRYFDLTQQEFAEKVGTTRYNIAGYETGKRQPSVAVISAICDKCNVNELWLRTGEGAMFAPEAKDALGAFIRERNLTSTDRILIEKFVSLSMKSRLAVVQYVLGIADALWEECKSLQPQSDDNIKQEAVAIAAEVHDQVILEKKAEAESSVSPSDTGGTAGEKMA